MGSIYNTISFILSHPLNKKRKAAALRRFACWQIGSRLVPGAVVVPFVDSTKLVVEPGMTGATGNIYCGLHELEDMALILHGLRPGDLFVDVGANVGSYTILASGAVGANSIAFEPHPGTFSHLLDNIRLNKLESFVSAKNVAIGASSTSLRFTAGLDTVNHILATNEPASDTIEVPVLPLDLALSGKSPTAIKIDVEGFETEVVNGATHSFQSPSLMAVIMELNGSGRRYKHDENLLHNRMLEWGFCPATYDPFTRSFTPIQSQNLSCGNTLYIRNMDAMTQRVQSAPMHTVLGSQL